MKQVINTTDAPKAIGPYSQGIAAEQLIFLSGQIPIDPVTGEIPDGIEAQTHRVFKNIAALLKASGTDFKDVVKTTVFLKDMGDFAAVNAIYAEYFTAPYPARSAVAVAALPRGVLIETECIVLRS
ncbi:MAG: RidA family protein [Clostridiales bacterium]|jgi:2-iminobutanoate/2-iminopropanoate deaminase|nr:RidA family protein [Clostridiales bacterium]